MSWIKLGACAVVISAAFAAPRPYLRHKNLNPSAYLSREMPARLIWGEVLFRSPFILGADFREKNNSCNSCHPNGAASDAMGTQGVVEFAHAPGMPLRIPALRGIRYLAPYGHDGRMASLRDFTQDVVTHAFAGEPLNNYDLDALVAYMREIDFLPNPKLDPRGFLSEKATADEKKGELVFMTSGCNGCHNPQSYFTDGKVWRLAQVKTASPYSMENGLKTPTLMRAQRSRYLHDGSAEDSTLLTAHAEQLGIRLEPTRLAALKIYLAALSNEEKPGDERHITEKASEIHSWLTLFLRHDVPDQRRSLILLKTLRLEFVALRAELSHPQDLEFFRSYLADLSVIIALAEKADPRPQIAQGGRAQDVQVADQAAFLKSIRAFNASMLPELRFLGTKR